MDRARRRALRLFIAVALIGCGPGDHEKNAGLGQLFGGGSAGKSTPDRPTDTGETSGDDSTDVPIMTATAGRAAPSGGGQASNGSAGTKAMAMRAGNPTAGAVSVGEPSGSTAGAGTMPAAAGTGAAAADAGTGSTCSAGYLAVADQCVCDLNGTFALHGKTAVSLASMAPVEGLDDTMDLWGIVRQDYDAQGNLGLSLNSCGQATPDICAAAQAPVLPSAEAYAQYVPVEVWGMPTPAATAQMSFPGALPGAAFSTPTFAQLFGVSLTNPLGAWPTARKNVDGGADFAGSATNGAHWVDIDADGKPGITIKIVAPGGAAASATSGPPQSYGATSSKCPRSDAKAARSPYAYLPMPQGLGVKRIKALYSAQRVRLEFHGMLESCDRISGMLTGAGAGKLQLDALIGGCAMVNGSAEAACSSAILDSAESGAGGGAISGLNLKSGSFVLARVPAETTCDQVRAMQLE